MSGEKRDFPPEAELNSLLFNSGNVELYNKILSSTKFNKTIEENQGNYMPGVTMDKVKNVTALGMMNEVFDICHIIYVWHDQKLKVVEYIKGFLNGWEKSLAELYLSLIKIAIKQDFRFDFESPHLVFIKDQIEKFKISVISKDKTTRFYRNWLSYFLGDEGMPAEPYMKGFLQVRGLLKTKAEIAKDFVKKNRDLLLSDDLRLLEIGKASEEKTEKVSKQILIISYLQKAGLFPKYDTRKGVSQTSIENFVAKLLNAKPETIKKSFQRLSDFKNSEKSTPLNVRHRIELLEDIKEDFSKMGLPNIAADIQQLIDSLRKKHKL